MTSTTTTTTTNATNATNATVKTVNPETVKKLSAMTKLQNAANITAAECKRVTYNLYLDYVAACDGRMPSAEFIAKNAPVFAQFGIALDYDSLRCVVDPYCFKSGKVGDEAKQRKVLAISTFRDVLGHWADRSESIVDYVIPAAPAVKAKKERTSKAKAPNKAEILAMLEEQKATNAALLAKLEALQMGAVAA